MFSLLHLQLFIVNPRRACAARVTVVIVSLCPVCLSVCVQGRTQDFSNVVSKDGVAKAISTARFASECAWCAQVSDSQGVSGDNTHALCAYASSARFAIDSPCRKLSLRSI